MSLETNAELVRRLFSQVLNRANPSAINEIIAEDYSEQEPYPNQPDGRAGVEARLAALYSAFPDARYELEDVITQDNRVVARWMMHGTQRGEFLGIGATNRAIVLTGMDIYVIKNDQIASHWDEVNLYGFLAQVDALPKR